MGVPRALQRCGGAVEEIAPVPAGREKAQGGAIRAGADRPRAISLSRPAIVRLHPLDSYRMILWLRR